MFHSDFQSKPYWWEAYEPTRYPLYDVPVSTRVAIVGAGYTGLAAALELARHGVESCILDSADPGYNASTRSGGIIAGPGGVKTPLINPGYSNQRYFDMVLAANDGLSLIEKLIRDKNIQCQWQRKGFLKLACTGKHLEDMLNKQQVISQISELNCSVYDRETIRDGIGSDNYHGGLLTLQGGHLHPALYFKGLLDAVEKSSDITICGQADVTDITGNGSDWSIQSTRGNLRAEDIIIATNGYTGGVTPQFRKRILPIKAYIIATEILDDEIAAAISPQDFAFAESTRIAPFFRLSGETGHQRLIFGSRVKWKDIEPAEMAPLLYKQMVDRFPQLKEASITHAWNGNVALTLDEELHNGRMDGLYYALGCNGSGVANMTYLGTQTARKLVSSERYSSPFDGKFPANPFYNGEQRWFVPIIGNYLMARDWWDRRKNKDTPG